MTGLSSHLIRAWEKRYNAIQPGRSVSEHRFYSDEDVSRLNLLKNAVRTGYRISEIADKTNQQLSELISNAGGTKEISEIGHFLKRALEEIENFNPSGLENILFEASIKLSQENVIHGLIIPLIHEIGDRWHKGIFSIAQEHLSTPVLISFLHYLKGIYKVPHTAPLLLTCTPRGQFHELGALIVSIMAASAGWQVIHLGTNLPAFEIAATADFSKAKIICLSIVYPYDDPELKKELRLLGNTLNRKIKITAGGSAAASYKEELDKSGIRLISDFRELTDYLSDNYLF